jgi:hypothetical protein
MTFVRLSIAASLIGALVLACTGDPGANSSTEVPTPAAPDEASEPTDVPGVSPDAASPPDPAAAEVLIAGYDRDIATAICAKLASCCSTENYNTFFAGFAEQPYDLKTPPPPAQCAAALAEQYGKLHGKWATSIAFNRIEFNPARAKKCVEDMNAAACGVPLSKALYDAACISARGNEVFVKRARTGTPCTDIGDGTFFGECDPKLGYCGSDKICGAWKKTGEPCSVLPTRQFCAPGLECDNVSPNRAGTCTAEAIVRQVGEPCLATSGPQVNCVAGSYCDWSADACTVKKADGAACKSDEDCATSHPFTCTPFGGGTCGSKSFCGGLGDAGSK